MVLTVPLYQTFTAPGMRYIAKVHYLYIGALGCFVGLIYLCMTCTVTVTNCTVGIRNCYFLVKTQQAGALASLRENCCITELDGQAIITLPSIVVSLEGPVTRSASMSKHYPY